MAFYAGVYYELGMVNPDPSDNIITIRARVTGSGTPVVTPAKCKYGKKIVLSIGFDDALAGQYTYAYTKFKNTFYDDGTGKQIPCHMTLVLPASAVKPDSDNNTNSLNVSQVAEMVAGGASINHHSDQHNGTAFDRVKDIIDGLYKFWDRFGYKTTIGTPPASELGFLMTFKNFGFQAENSPVDDGTNIQKIYGKGYIDDIPTDKFIIFDRAHRGDAWNADEEVGVKQYFDEGMTDWNANHKELWYNIFTHWAGQVNQDGTPIVAEINRFKGLIDYALNNPALDTPNITAILGVQEQFDYLVCARTSVVTKTLVGDLLTITIDQNAVHHDVRFKTMSLNLSGVAISSIESHTGCDQVTFNPTTGLINAYLENAGTATDPRLDPKPAQFTSVIGSGNDVIITFDKAVTQSLTAGYSIAGLNVTGLTGNGRFWTVSFNTSVANKFLTYKSYLGDAVTVENGMRAGDYVNYPIS